MKLIQIQQILQEVQKVSTKPDLTSNDVDAFCKNNISSFKDEVTAFTSGRDKFGSEWFSGRRDMLYYCLSRGYALYPCHQKDLDDALTRNKNKVLEILHNSIRRGGSEVNTSIIEMLNNIEGFVYDGNPSSIQQVVAGWRRKNDIEKQYVSIKEQVQEMLNNTSERQIASKISTLLNISVTEYHVQHIEQEITGDGQVDVNWWKEEMFRPWLIQQVINSNVLDTAQLHRQAVQLFGVNIPPKNRTSMTRIIHEIGGIDKLRNIGHTQDFDDFVEKHLSDIMKVINLKMSSISQKIDYLNTKYKDAAPRLFDSGLIRMLKKKYGEQNTISTRKQQPKTEVLRALIPEIQELRKTMSVDEILTWLSTNIGIVTTRNTLIKIGAITPTKSKDPLYDHVLPYLLDIKQMKSEGKSNTYVQRWLSHKNIELTIQQIVSLLQRHAATT